MAMRRNILTSLALITILILAALCCRCDSDSHVQRAGRVDIYFVQSWYMTTSLPLDCGQLQSGEFPAQETSILDSSELASWDQVLQSLKTDPRLGKFRGDCRVCCLVYDPRGQLLHSISLWPSGMKVDDSVFYIDRALVALVRRHLPQGYLPDSLQEEPYDNTAVP